MKNNQNLKIKIIVLFLATVIMLQACATNNQRDVIELNVKETETPGELQTEESKELAASNDSYSEDNQQELSDDTGNDPAIVNNFNDELSREEIEGLIFMREEEKLAKDVYLGLYELWGIPIFQNIANSEQNHTDAVKKLLDTFGIEDPTDTSPTGVFMNEELQNLYDDLMSLGSQSVGEALKVGGAIEEIDILDLKEYLEITRNESIRRVYENLLRGSENHLRAFVSNYERQTNVIYQPQYMDLEDYDAILSSSSSRGGRGRGNRP